MRAIRLASACACLVALACVTNPQAGSRPAPGSLPARLAALPAAEAGRPAHLVLVSVAGLDPSAYRADAGARPGAGMPTLRALAAAGVSADRVEGVSPPAIYPVHTTLVSGRSPAQHGVPADLRLGERGVRRARYSHASHVKGATLWQAAVAAGRPVAALDWPATLGAAIPMLLPDVAPQRRGETWLALVRESATPWIHQRAAARADPELQLPGAARDRFLVDTACALLGSENPPALLLLRLSQTEIGLRRGGPGSERARAAFAAADAELARLVDCLDAGRGGLAESALVVSGDRAFAPAHTQLHVNEVLKEAGLLGRGEAWTAIARSNGGSAFVYARDADAALLARRALAEEAERTRAFRVVAAQEMIRLAADPEAWFGLEAEPGYLFIDALGQPRVRAASSRAAAGYLFGEGSSGFVAYGRGLRRELRVPRLRQTDVAPTLAALLGLPLDGAAGRPLVGALALPSASPRAGVRSSSPPPAEAAGP